MTAKCPECGEALLLQSQNDPSDRYWYCAADACDWTGDRLESECHGYDLDGNPVGHQYDYEGEAVAIDAFIRDNEIVHPDDLADIRNLNVGEELRYGGGAAPITVLKRVR